MRRVMHFAIDDILPSEREVLERFDMPPRVTISTPLRALLDDASQKIRRLAEPRGVMQEISLDDFRTVYRGDGDNAESSPLDLIAPRATALALFVGTIGDAVGKEIARLFKEDDPASGAVLDAFASETTNRVAYALANEFETTMTPRPAHSSVLRTPSPPHAGEKVLDQPVGVLPYSPGYCGWHVSGQRAIFASIVPDDIGVTLNASCLMSPVKSVSGVLVAGDAAVHRFRPAYAFCDECKTQDCVSRMRSMRR